MSTRHLLAQAAMPRPATSPAVATSSLDDRLAMWQGLQRTYARMPLAERDGAVQKLKSRVPGVDAIAHWHFAEHSAARFGSARFYSHVLDVVVNEIALLIKQDQPRATETDIAVVSVDRLSVLENSVLSCGRAAALAEAGHMGAFRHVISIGEAPSTRWLWGTVLALVWCIGAAGTADEFAAAARSIHAQVGDREFRLFGAIMLSLHRLFGLLPAPVHANLARYFAA